MQDAQSWLKAIIPICVVVASGCNPSENIDVVNQPPSLELRSPTDGSQYQPGPLYIEAQVSDNEDGADALTVAIVSTRTGGSPITIQCEGGVNAPSASGLFSCTTATEFTNGDYTLQVTATDSRNSTSSNAPVSITVQNDAPTCLFRTPESGSTTSYDESVPATMILTCDDPDGENSAIEVCIDSDLNGRLGCGQASSSGEVTVQVKFTTDGEHVVIATATDEAGSEGQDSFTALVKACKDLDGDGFSVCTSVSDPPDCDDDDYEAFPSNDEICNGSDSDCDGIPDNIPDLDGDGYGCDDCDNSVISINPSGIEICDGKDNDCDESVDEDFDLDGDGYMSACVVGEKGIDCDDSNILVHPDAQELCDGLDTDCNGAVDDKDFDKDGWIDSGCSGYTGDFPGDCNEANPRYNPGVVEICDGNDEDCDGRIDNDTPCFDDDGDGFCELNCTDSSVPDGDCDDDFRYTYPGAEERFDNRDNNCDGLLEDRILPIDLAWLLLDGSSQSSQHGKSMDGGGDVNGDGIGDMIIGAPAFNNQIGQAHVILGQEFWDVGVPTSIEDMENAYTYTESRAGSEAGTAVSILGDLDDDGIDDFAIASPKAPVSFPGFTFDEAGSTYVFLGKESGWGNSALTSATTRIDGTADNVHVGESLSGGDVNGDGFADVLIGAPHPGDGATAGSGWVFIFPGRYSGFPAEGGPTSVFQLTGDPGQTMGRDIAFVGRHDGDNIGDFAVTGDGSSADIGLVQRLPGSSGYISNNRTSLVENRTGAWQGEGAGNGIGRAIDGGVDFDGNGYDDILFGRELMEFDDSMAFAVMGANGVTPRDGYAEDLTDIRFIGQESDSCPCTVAAIGDMNGDGIGDIAVASAFATVTYNNSETGEELVAQEAGRVYLLYGRDYTLNPWPAEVNLVDEADAIFYGTEVGQRIGLSLEGLGDINGDGWDELGIAAPYFDTPNDDGSSNALAGRVYVQYGAPSPLE